MLSNVTKKLMQNTSLKLKFFISSIFGVSVLSLIIIFVSISSSEKQIQKTLESFVSNTTIPLDNGISAQFYERYGDVQAFAVNSVLLNKNEFEISEVFNNYSSMYGIYSVILFVDMDGKFIASNTKSPDGKIINHYKLKSINFSNTEWFKKVIQGEFTNDKTNYFEGTYVEDTQFDPYIELTSGNKVLSTGFSTIVKNKDGVRIGVLTNRANFSWIGNEIINVYNIAQENKYQNVEVLILNREGQTIVNYSPFRNKKNQQIDYNFKIRNDTLLKSMQPIQNALNGHAGVELYYDTTLNENLYFSYSKIKSKKFIPSINWTLVFSIPEKEILNINSNNNIIVTLFTSLIFILTIIFSIIYSNNLSNKFSFVSKNLKKTAESSMNSVHELVHAFEKLTENSLNQSNILSVNSKSLSEINGMINHTADNITNSKNAAFAAALQAEDGYKAMEKMHNSVKRIESTYQSLQEMQNIIEKINEKTLLIHEIVFQTKILSFNASIEAARAGELGKGFSVVADEVGNLAKTSGSTAKEIDVLLSESNHRVLEILNDSKERIQEGIQTSQEAFKIFKSILTSIDKIKNISQEIEKDSIEQKHKIESTFKSSVILNESTENNKKSTEVAFDSVNNVKENSHRIMSSVQLIDMLIQGSKK